MNKKSKELQDAKKYVASMQKVRTYENVSLTTMVDTMKILAKANKADEFKTLVDSYVTLMKKEQSNPASPFSKYPLDHDPLCYLEILCRSLDYGFAAVGYGLVSHLPPGPIQNFFNKQYGSVADRFVKTSNKK